MTELEPWQRASWMALYPRNWEVEPDKPLIGLYDISSMFGMSMQGLRQRMRDLRLPLADGPDINSYPTWTRGTILVWLYLIHSLPVSYIGEAMTFISGPHGKETIERVKEQVIDRRLA